MVTSLGSQPEGRRFESASVTTSTIRAFGWDGRMELHSAFWKGEGQNNTVSYFAGPRFWHVGHDATASKVLAMLEIVPL